MANSQLQRLLNEAEMLLRERVRLFAERESAGAWQRLKDAAVSYAAVLEVDQERRLQEQQAAIGEETPRG